VGDVRGVLEITRPLDRAVAQARSGLQETFVLMAAMAVLGVFGLGLGIGRLRRSNAELTLTLQTLEKSIDKVALQRDELAHVARVAALGELTGALAHELSQPLSSIRTNVHAARRSLADGRPLADLGDTLIDIDESATRADQLIRRLRGLLRRREIEKAPLDLNEVLRDVEPIARTEAGRHHARLVLQLAPGLPQAAGDAVQLQQVFLNLVRNAAEAMAGMPAEDREILVRTSIDTPGQLTVAVEDAGPPIDAATLDAMFQPFHTTKPDGLGMGLAICRSIIEAHDGRLWATPRDGRGLLMRFTLPAGREG
jgi:signal transduction histidine kinase